MLRILFLLLFATSLSAQRDTTGAFRRLEVGCGFGILQHSVDFTPTVNDEVLQGNNYGLTLRYFDSPLIGFQAELSYVEAGWQENFGPASSSLYVRRNNYAELLILTQLSIGKGAVQPLVQFGPYVSVPLSGSEEIPAGFPLPDPDQEPPAYYDRDLPFRINYGGQVGVGFNLLLGPLTVQADGRFLIGFNDLIRTGETTAVISRRTGVGGHVALLYALPGR